MTAPSPPFTGPISAAEDLAVTVLHGLGERVETRGTGGYVTSWAVVDDTIAALLAGGLIREEWGARYHNPAGDADTWRDTRQEAEAMIVARAEGGWRHPSSLVRRFVVVTAAEVVP